MADMEDEVRRDGRVSINVRIDGDKFAIIEKKRITGFGMAKTERNRSDVCNELLGLGIQTDDFRERLGDREFARFWYIVNNVDIKKFNLECIEKLIMAKR